MSVSYSDGYAGINGTERWWVDGRFHRVDGPAIEWTDGTVEWWFDGERFDGVGFLLDVFLGVVVNCGDWLPVVLVVGGVEFGR